MYWLRIRRDISAAEVPPWKAGDPSLKTGSSDWNQEEQPPQHLTVKISQDSIYLGETEGFRKPRCPHKGLVHRLTHSQALILYSNRRMMTQEVPDIYRERLSCTASECWSRDSWHCHCVESSSHGAKSQFSLAWWALLTPPWWFPGALPHPTWATPKAFTAGRQVLLACTMFFPGIHLTWSGRQQLALVGSEFFAEQL